MHNKRYFKAAVEACQALGERGIIITTQDDLLWELPETIGVFRYVPFGPLLSEIAAVVHHGGVGTAARCIAAGLPQVVIPTLYNQPDTAQRLQRLGVGRHIPPRKLDATSMTRAIREVLSSRKVGRRCTELASKIDRSRGLKQTVSLIEAACPGGATAGSRESHLSSKH